MKRRYHLLQGGPRRRDTQTFVPILWQGQGFKRNNFYLAIRNILIKGTLWFGTGFRDRDKVISTANSQNLELPEYQTSTQLFFSRVCTQNLCFLLILQSAEWHKVKCKSRLNPNQHWKCARTPSAALACAWPMVFISLHSVFHCIYTQQCGGAQGTARQEDAEKHPLDFQTNIQCRQGFIHATADSSGGTAPSVPVSTGKNTHLLKQDRRWEDRSWEKWSLQREEENPQNGLRERAPRPGKEKERE